MHPNRVMDAPKAFSVMSSVTTEQANLLSLTANLGPRPTARAGKITGVITEPLYIYSESVRCNYCVTMLHHFTQSHTHTTEKQ